MTGRFIVFEGGEGAGKSTAINALAAELKAAGQDIVLTREPGGSPRAEEIRTLLLRRSPDDSFNWDTQLALFYAARFEHLAEVILPALRAGKTVLCDRFELSTYQYQITAGNASLGLFRHLHEHVSRMLERVGMTTPEYVIFDLDPEVGLARVRQAKLDSGDDVPDVFDDADIEFHRKLTGGVESGLRELYVQTAHHIDASRAPVEVLADIREKLQL